MTGKYRESGNSRLIVRQRGDLVLEVVLIDLSGSCRQLHEQVQASLPVAPDVQLVTRMLGRGVPASSRSERWTVVNRSKGAAARSSLEVLGAISRNHRKDNPAWGG